MRIAKLFTFFISTSLVFLLTACSSSMPIPLSIDTNATNYDKLIGDALSRASTKLQNLKKSGEVVLVSDFVNIDSLHNKSKLGFLLSSTLKDNLTSKHGLTIREVELSQNFKLGNEGLRLLSRNQHEVDPNIYSESYAVVGTYTLTSKQLIVFVKIIDIYTGHVLASTSNRTRMTEEIRELDKSPKKLRIYSPMVL